MIFFSLSSSFLLHFLFCFLSSHPWLFVRVQPVLFFLAPSVLSSEFSLSLSLSTHANNKQNKHVQGQGQEAGRLSGHCLFLQRLFQRCLLLRHHARLRQSARRSRPARGRRRQRVARRRRRRLFSPGLITPHHVLWCFLLLLSDQTLFSSARLFVRAEHSLVLLCFFLSEENALLCCSCSCFVLLFLFRKRNNSLFFCLFVCQKRTVFCFCCFASLLCRKRAHFCFALLFVIREHTCDSMDDVCCLVASCLLFFCFCCCFCFVFSFFDFFTLCSVLFYFLKYLCCLSSFLDDYLFYFILFYFILFDLIWFLFYFFF